MLDRLHLWSRRFLGVGEGSGDRARRRLQLVLVQDRIGMSPTALEELKKELLAVVKRHLVIDEASVEVEIRSSGPSMILAANMAVRDMTQGESRG